MRCGPSLCVSIGETGKRGKGDRGGAAIETGERRGAHELTPDDREYPEWERWMKQEGVMARKEKEKK